MWGVVTCGSATVALSPLPRWRERVRGGALSTADSVRVAAPPPQPSPASAGEGEECSLLTLAGREHCHRVDMGKTSNKLFDRQVLEIDRCPSAFRKYSSHSNSLTAPPACMRPTCAGGRARSTFTRNFPTSKN